MIGQAEQLTLELTLKPIIVGSALGVLLALAYSCFGVDKPYLEKFKANFFPALGYSLPIALVGYVTGYLTGISRSPAVGTAVPAVLALLGGLNIYFFGSESKNKALVGYSIFAFSLVFFYGLWGGVVARETGRIDRFFLLAEQEKIIKAYRQNRDLPAEPPEWLLKSDP